MWNNTAIGDGDDIYVDADNDVNGIGFPVNLYNNNFTDFYINDSDNLLEGSNINTNPLFLNDSDPDPANWDLHITSSSLCKDAGTAAAPELPTTDVDGQPRTIGSAPDMGADEFSPIPSIPLLLGGGDGGGGGGCFIATAAYGSGMAKEVKVFQRVRDEYLLTNELGKIFVSAYYTYSPPLADWMAKYPMLRKTVRIGLYPILGLSKWFVGENPKNSVQKELVISKRGQGFK